MKLIRKLFILIFCTVNVFAQLTPKLISGLQLWLRADSNVVFNTSTSGVSSWNDLSGNNNNATQSTPAFMPQMTQRPLLNDQKCINFNTSLLTMANGLTIGTCFVLGNWSGNNTVFPDFNGLITQPTGGATEILFVGYGGTANFYPAFFGSSIFVNNVNSQSYAPLNDYKIIMGSATSKSFTNLQIGRDRNFTSRYWIGDVAEVIIYATQLTNTEKNQVLDYFHQKYGAKVQLGTDRCFKKGELLTPTKTFASYQWSNNATTAGIAINDPGEYWLRGTDVFGEISMDTILIAEVVDLNKPLTNAICMNDTLVWDTKLGAADYSFRWNGNVPATVGFLAITATGSYSLQVQHLTSGCLVSDTLSITTTVGNNLKSQISLGGDTSICSGNPVGLIKGEAQVISFLWSTGNKTSKQIVTLSGQYILKAKNIYGCTASDTVQVLSILGFAPAVNFKYDSVCAGNLVNFTDLSTPPSGNIISKIYWQFNDGLIDSLNTNPTIIAPASGLLKVKLTEKANNNCSNTVEKILSVNPVPGLTFLNTDVCTGVPMNFAPLVTLTSGSIASWNWNFDAGATAISSLKNPEFTYTATGMYTVALTVRTNKSCQSSVSETVAIKKSIPVDFTYDSECSENIVHFFESTNYPDDISAFSRLWDLGDSTFTSVSAPAKNYPAPGVYQAKLTVTASNGCTNSITKPVKVKSYPVPDFNVGNVCKNVPVKFTNLSTSAPDTINGYNWDFANSQSSVLKEPVVIFSDTGSFNVRLLVSSSSCQASVTKSVKVTAASRSVFSLSQIAGEAPLAISTVNKTSSATTYHWDFGNGSQSTDINPSVTYTGNGNYTIRLIAYNAYGCADTSSSTIVVNLPVWDLELKTIISIKDGQGKYLRINAKLRNNSNRAVDSVWVHYDQPDHVGYLQLLKGRILPGADTVFSMINLVAYNDGLSYYCLSVQLPADKIETNLSNNTLCEVLSGHAVVYTVEPNPAGNQVNVNFALPEASEVIIRMINSIGSITYENTVSMPKGYHTFLIDSQSFSNGLYFLQFNVGSVKNVQRVMIMK